MSQTEKAILKISQSKEKLEEFLSKNTMDELYEFILKEDDTILRTKFEEFMIDALENCPKISSELTEKDLAKIAGGKSNFNKKLMSTALSALTILPTAAPLAGAVEPTNGSSAESSVTSKSDLPPVLQDILSKSTSLPQLELQPHPQPDLPPVLRDILSKSTSLTQLELGSESRPATQFFALPSATSSAESTLDAKTLTKLESIKRDVIAYYDTQVDIHGIHPVFDITNNDDDNYKRSDPGSLSSAFIGSSICLLNTPITESLQSELIEINTIILNHIIDKAENASPGFTKTYESYLNDYIKPLLDPTRTKEERQQIINALASDISKKLSDLGDSISDDDLKNILGVFSLARLAELMAVHFHYIQHKQTHMAYSDIVSTTTANLLASSAYPSTDGPTCHPLLSSYIMTRPNLSNCKIFDRDKLQDSLSKYYSKLTKECRFAITIPKVLGINALPTDEFGNMYLAALTQIHNLTDTLPGVELKFTNNLADSITKIINDTKKPITELIYKSRKLSPALTNTTTTGVMNNINVVLKDFHNKLMTAAEQQMTSRFPSLSNLQTDIIGNKRLLDPNNNMVMQKILTGEIAKANVRPEQLSDQFQLFRLSILNQILINIRAYFENPTWIETYRANPNLKTSCDFLYLLTQNVNEQIRLTIKDILKNDTVPPMFEILAEKKLEPIYGDIKPLAFICDGYASSSLFEPDLYGAPLERLNTSLQQHKRDCSKLPYNEEHQEHFNILSQRTRSYLEELHQSLPLTSDPALIQTHKRTLQQYNTNWFNAIMNFLSVNPKSLSTPYARSQNKRYVSLQNLLGRQPLYSSTRTLAAQREITRRICTGTQNLGSNIRGFAILAELLLRIEKNPSQCTIINTCTDPELRDFVNKLDPADKSYLYLFLEIPQ